MYLHQVHCSALPQPEMHRTCTRRCVPHGRGYVVILRPALSNYFDPRTNRVAVTPGALQPKFKPMIRARTPIRPDLGGSTQCTYNNVQASIAIEIAHRRTAVP